MINAGIYGAAGYTAGELIRILHFHPEVNALQLISESHAGQPVYTAHPDLEGTLEAHFVSSLTDDVDVVFLCSGHGKSKELIERGTIPEDVHVIDLSHDYRLQGAHDFIYGLPELNKLGIKEAKHVANPGCFATAIQLCLLPLAQTKALKHDVHISAITGSSGAGQRPTDTTHFSWRSNNASIYKAFTHQHLGEIHQSIAQLHPTFEQAIHFIPIRGAFTRGILAACYTTTSLSLEALTEQYEAYYFNHPFIHLSGSNPDVKRVVNTNKAYIHLEKHHNQVLITGVIDNLIKGASGQAIQNMNLMFGFDEETGLTLKASAF
ncbi:MAG: N-acetyl-gamma-glutamyl-phosphate reductase [Bacteroidota bacterium]